MEHREKTKNRYLILAAGMVIQFCAGIIYMWSVFKAPVTAHLKWEASAAAMTSSIMLAAFVVGIILGGRTQDKIGPRKVSIFGSVLIGAGMIATSFVSPLSPWVLYITYGIIGGLGVGAVYTSTVSAIQKWFPDKRGFATGMTVSAFGFSLVVFAPLANAMLSGIGVPKTFLTFGIVFFAVCVICSLLISNPAAAPAPAGSVEPKIGGSTGTQRQYTTKEMLKTKQFYLIALSLFLILPAYFILNPMLMTLGIERNLSEQTAVAGVMVTGVASAAGRLIVTWISDKVGRKAALYGISILTLLAILALIAARGMAFLACIAVIAFAFGGASGLYATITAEHFGTKHMGANYGCVMVGFGVSALLFPMISNSLAANGSYTMSFVVAALTCAAAFVLILLLKKPGEEGRPKETGGAKLGAL